MKTVCIYHSIDLDGWMSAAIVKHWFITNNVRYTIKDLDNGFEEGKLTAGNDELYFKGYNYGQPIPDLLEYDKVIMCDISFPKEEMDKIHNKNLTWIDHHISAINMLQYTNNRDSSYCAGIRDINFAACELTWKYFFPNETMPEIVRLLGRYDCFGHKDTDEEQKVLEFQYGARQAISNYKKAYYYLKQEVIRNIGNVMFLTNTTWEYILEQGKAVYSYLCTEAKQIYKNGFEIELEEEIEYNNDSPVHYTRKFIAINRERFNPINFGIDYHADGYDGAACFHYANGMWKFSLYNDNGEVDCSIIAKQFDGGGHKGASGFVTDDIKKFLIK